MRRRLGVLVAVLLVLVSCTAPPEGRTAFEGFRDLEDASVIEYRVAVAQRRTASGLGEPKRFASNVRIELEEEATDETSYALVVRGVVVSGDDDPQASAASRLAGRRLLVDLDDGKVGGDEQVFSGTQDVAAADIGMLFTLFAPVIPSPRADVGERWRVAPDPVSVPWSRTPLALTVTHEIVGRERVEGLDALRVKSIALGNVAFRLPIVSPAPPPSPAGAPPSSTDELIVNQLFDQLFADIDNPVEGVAAAIAAIPLAVVAPFVAIGEAIGDLFGGSGSDEAREPEIPVVDLAGPIELRSDTRIWDADGRVLDGLGNGTMRLEGRVPELPGAASELTGKPLALDVDWKLRRTHVSAFPADRDPPGRGPLPVAAVVGLVLAAAAAAVGHVTSRRRTRA